MGQALPESYLRGFSNPNLAPTQNSYGYDREDGTISLPFATVKQAIQSVREKGAKYIAPERMSAWLPEIDSLFFDENS